MKCPIRCRRSGIVVLLLVDAGVTREAVRRLAEELGGHWQVSLGAAEVDVTEVGRRQRQAGLDIGAFAVPGDEAVNSEGVARIMKPRLAGGAWRAVHCGVRAQPAERAFKLSAGNGFARVRSEEGRVGSGRHRQMAAHAAETRL